MMNAKSFLILAGTTAIAATLAVTSSLTWNQSSAVAERGKIFLPDLAKNAESIGSIKIETKDETMTLTRDGNRFLDASGFPVKREAARELLASASLLKIEEKKTADASRHEDLELAAPGAKKGAGKKITFLGKDGKPMSGLIAGEADSSVGGVSGGQYVRALDSDQTYLARGAVKLPYSRAGWFDNRLIELDEKKLVSAAISASADSTAKLTKVGGKLKLVDLPDGKIEDEDKIRRLTRVFAKMTFSDVRKAEGQPADGAPTMTVATTDGITYTVTSAEKDKENAHWVRVGAVKTDDSAAAKAKELTEKFGGFEFKISSYDGETFGWKIDDLTKAAGS